MAKKRTKKDSKQVASLTHDGAKRRNIPTVELQSDAEVLEEKNPREPVRYERGVGLGEGERYERDESLDPQLIWQGAELRLDKKQLEALRAGEKIELGESQLVWRGKDQQDWSDLIVPVPPIYVQEKIHPKHIVEELRHRTKIRRDGESDAPALPDLFGDSFNGLSPAARTEFYQHDQNWQNRMILGDSLQVMASLAERESLRGKVQCIYFDPPYGIRFNSNWQVSTRSRDVKDGKQEHITREPEQVKAFRDTWSDGIHSYLTYLRDRLTAARDLLTESGSIFVQIGDENVHRVRALMDEVFGNQNFVSLIAVQTTTGFETTYLGNVADYVLWYTKNKEKGKARTPYYRKEFVLGEGNARWLMFDDFSYRGVRAAESRGEEAIPENAKPYKPGDLASQGRAKERQPFFYHGKEYDPWGKNSHWKASHPIGMTRLARAGRIHVAQNSIQYVRYHTDFDVAVHSNIWTDTGSGSFTDDKIYVVQTNTKVIERCILMATDPGDLVLDPTCGSGTAAYVAEQWGRRWITMDTSRVSLALARARIMGASYPYYYLADTPEGQKKEEEVSGELQSETPTSNNIRLGFVYERVPHIMLKSIANNKEIDAIWEKRQPEVEAALGELNAALNGHSEPFPVESGGRAGGVVKFDQIGTDTLPSGEEVPVHLLLEWEVPRNAPSDWPPKAQKPLERFWQARIARQQEIDQSIASRAEFETLYDKPFTDNSKIRVAGPFTVESLSPHRVFDPDESEQIDDLAPPQSNQDFATIILQNLQAAGVQQSDKKDRITFTAIEGFDGEYIGAIGSYDQNETSQRAAIFIGPEYGSITRSHITKAASEAHRANCDILIACGFNFDAHSSELDKLGPLPILKAKINPDLHMANDLKNTGAGNLFVVFGEPDIKWQFNKGGKIVVEVLGIDVFDPKTGQVRASGKDDIAAWFIDTNYNGESFFVRHAYFMGANDPYKSLKNSLKNEIDEEAWKTLYRDTSRPFPRPEQGCFAVKVINHFGDEVMKVFGVGEVER